MRRCAERDANSNVDAVAQAGQRDLKWLTRTAEADNLGGLCIKVALTGMCECVGEVLLGTLGTYIYPGIGTDLGELIGGFGLAAALV